MTESRATVLIPVFQAAHLLPALAQSLASQCRAFDEKTFGRLLIIAIDNCSMDGTADRFVQLMDDHGLSDRFTMLRNERNLGLAGSLNRGLASVRTDFVITCHADCRFASDDYASTVVRVLAEDPDVAAVTGVPLLDPEGAGAIDRIYAASNLMDLGSPGEVPRGGMVEDIGFAEGRCDGFRMSALRRAGLYDTRVRLAGEDQLLSARLVADGGRVVQHTGIGYFLGLSPQQDSLWRTVAHQRRLGQPAAFILLHPGVGSGAFGGRSGGNRRRRSILRALQMLNVLAMGWWMFRALRRRRARAPAAIAIAASAARQFQMQSAPGVRLTLTDRIALLVMQPAWDVAWVEGFAEGLGPVIRHRVHAAAQKGDES